MVILTRDQVLSGSDSTPDVDEAAPSPMEPSEPPMDEAGAVPQRPVQIAQALRETDLFGPMREQLDAQEHMLEAWRGLPIQSILDSVGAVEEATIRLPGLSEAIAKMAELDNATSYMGEISRTITQMPALQNVAAQMLELNKASAHMAELDRMATRMAELDQVTAQIAEVCVPAIRMPVMDAALAHLTELDRLQPGLEAIMSSATQVLQSPMLAAAREMTAQVQATLSALGPEPFDVARIIGPQISEVLSALGPEPFDVARIIGPQISETLGAFAGLDMPRLAGIALPDISRQFERSTVLGFGIDFTEVFRSLSTVLDEWWAPGTFMGDVFIVWKGRYEEDDVKAALQRLASRYFTLPSVWPDSESWNPQDTMLWERLVAEVLYAAINQMPHRLPGRRMRGWLVRRVRRLAGGRLFGFYAQVAPLLAGAPVMGELPAGRPSLPPGTTPRVPRRAADRRRWEATWPHVRSQVQQARSYASICAWLAKTHPELACSTDILADIIRAGEAGLLNSH